MLSDFFFIFTSFKMRGKPQNDYLLVKKGKSFHKYCPMVLRTSFSTKTQPDAKVYNSAFWNISHLGLRCSSAALNKRVKKKWDIWSTKSYKKTKFHRVRVELEMKACLIKQSVHKFMKLSTISTSLECFTAGFFHFLSTAVKIWLLGKWLEICYHLLISNFWVNLWGNSNIYILMMIF